MRGFLAIIWLLQFCGIFCTNCVHFWEKWQSCPIMTQLPSSLFPCFKANDGTYLLINTEMDMANMQCDYKAADVDLFQCLQIGEISKIDFSNCIFPTTFLKDYIFKTKISYFSLTYNKTDIINHDIIINELEFLKTVFIVGAVTSLSINIKFENLPMMNTISLYQTNFSNFTFHTLPELQKLSMVNCSISHLSSSVFRNLSSLLLLNLGENLMEELPIDVFEGLNSLQVLHLHSNRFKILKNEWFKPLKSLRFLNLFYNQLTMISAELVQSLPNLVALNTSYNPITELLNDTFHKALPLEMISMDNCSLQWLPSSLFQNSRFLSNVSFEDNEILMIPSTLFSRNLLLVSISFDNNKLSQLHKNTFVKLSSLSVLLLGRNKISNLPSKIFSDLHNLIDLDLNSNKLNSLDSIIFQNLSKLQSLDLSQNNLILFSGVYPFGYSPFLSMINLSRNNFIEFPVLNWNSRNPIQLDISYNNLSVVTLSIMSHEKTKVDMRFNPISIISIEQISDESKKEPVIYNLENFTFVCDCKLQGFLKFLENPLSQTVFPNSRAMSCSYPEEYKGVILTEISPIYSICPVSPVCPQNCQCFENDLEEVIVDCRKKDLYEPPEQLPLRSVTIYLDQNNLTEFNINSTYWENVTELHLSNNFLTSLQNWHIPNLRILKLNGNQLGKLPISLMDHVQETSNFEIYLADNSWLCNCEATSFKQWYTRNLDKIFDSNVTYCKRKISNKPTFSEQLIREVSIDLFCPKAPKLLTGEIIAISLTVISISVLLLCSAVCYYRFSKVIMAFLYSRNLYCRCCDRHLKEEEKMYDAFICYGSADQDVMLEILQNLEPTYHLCVHERDWVPGYPISHQIVHSVQNSRKTVILLSKEFLESMWFQVEFRTAYNQMMEDKKHRLILVIIGNLDNVNELESDLRYLLSTKTYLEWGKKWFWEKLRYALRHRCKKEKNFENKNQQKISEDIQMDVIVL
ncbi:protein toll-like [Centruroides vittatus]|uniref:protein toll-like n=1 Tax=Centruroides vittatus TaxID=120091 RepID=UPI00350FD2C0